MSPPVTAACEPPALFRAYTNLHSLDSLLQKAIYIIAISPVLTLFIHVLIMPSS